MLFKSLKSLSTVKLLKATAVSIPKGIKATYPNLQDKTIDIQNALEVFISTLAACETATLRAIAKKSDIKVGAITFLKIESGYDLTHWRSGGGKDNKLNDIFLDAQVEANITEGDFVKIKEQVQNLCPIYQMIKGSGVKIHSNWRLKQIA